MRCDLFRHTRGLFRPRGTVGFPKFRFGGILPKMIFCSFVKSIMQSWGYSESHIVGVDAVCVHGSISILMEFCVLISGTYKCTPTYWVLAK